jgi:hypothetical protein
MMMMRSDDEQDVVGPQPLFRYTELVEIHGVTLAGEWLLQAKRMPPSMYHLLIDCDEEQALRSDPNALVLELGLQGPTYSHALAGLALSELDAVRHEKGAITPETCATLRTAVESDRQMKCDSVDGSPDHQLHLSEEQLVALVGKTSLQKLTNMAVSFAALQFNSSELEGMSPTIFVRRYSPSRNCSMTEANVAAARERWSHMLTVTAACLGARVAQVVEVYGAPYMRPTAILQGSAGGECCCLVDIVHLAQVYGGT